MISGRTREDAVTICTMVASAAASGLGHASACLRLGIDRESGAGGLARDAYKAAFDRAPWLDDASAWAEAASLVASGEWDPWGSADERRAKLTEVGQRVLAERDVAHAIADDAETAELENAPGPADVHDTPAARYLATRTERILREDNAAHIERTTP